MTYTPPLMNNYVYQPFTLERAQGCRVWDTDNNEYLDFAGGMGSLSLGHCAPAISKALSEQSRKITACGATFHTIPRSECAQMLVDNSCFDKVCFANSGTEAVEAALKLSRKWAHETKGEDANEIITFTSAYHGRSYGAFSATDKSRQQKFFTPYLPGMQFAEFNDLESVAALVSDKTAAVIIEPVQGDGGLNKCDVEFLRGLRALCDKENIALIFDEVQCGMGRLGTLFAYEFFGVEPDMAALSKGIGGGMPQGALVAKEKFAKHFTAGVHGSTLAGNPLSCAVSIAVLTQMTSKGFLKNVRDRAAQFRKGLEALEKDLPVVLSVHGQGLMIGIDTSLNNGQLRAALRDNKLLATQAGKSIVRFLPPLIVTSEEIDEALGVLRKTITQLS